ncbi:MAG: hypothetical protein D6830_03860, partial [Ignavibacteria bacterium]
MYHIDLTNLKNFLADEESQKRLELKCDNTYQEIIIGNLNNQKPISGCMSCSSIEACGSMPVDEREIVEVSCDGLLGTDYCEISPGLDDNIERDDLVIVTVDGFQEIAQIVSKGELVKIKRKGQQLFGEELPKIIRKANQDDLIKYEKNISEEVKAVPIFKEKVDKY